MMTLSADFARGKDESGVASTGIEYEVWRMLALRAGFKMGQEIGSGFRAGVGFKLKRWTVDYAFANFGVLGSMHRAGITARLGGAAAWVRPKASDRFRQEQEENRRYIEEAKDLWDEALKGDGGAPDPEEDRMRLSRLANLSKALDLSARPDRAQAFGADTEQGKVGFSAVAAYLRGNGRKALLLAQAAHGMDRSSEAFAALLKAIGSLTYQTPEADALLPPSGIVKVKLDKALLAFRKKRFEEAEAACQDALYVDPDSARAHERLGSIFFAMGRKAEALREWREALRLEPSNAALKDFMRRIGETP